MNIVEPLLQYATHQPNKMALIFEEQHRTYAQLVRAMKRIVITKWEKPAPSFVAQTREAFFEMYEQQKGK